MTNRRTDFNDLHKEEGLDAVKHQVEAAIAAANNCAVASSPVPPSHEVPPAEAYEYDEPVSSPDPIAEESGPLITLDTALKRFAYAMPDGKVWDGAKQVLLKATPAKNLMGPKLFREWMEHEQRRVVDQDDVNREAKAAQKVGSGPISDALCRYVYLYPTDSVWDREKREIVPISALKYAISNCFSEWIDHPAREQIDRENLVFDPTQQVDPYTHINMFRGLPLKPEGDEAKCEAIIETVHFLCNGDMEVMRWLVNWLAYPLQNVGAKMATAVMMHSEIQGSGKSLLFDGVMRKIYGEYGATLGQHQLESQYTDWRSQKLYGLFEEIFSRGQKYSHTGTVKHMITGETHRIEKKFVSGWEESNHMNAVFLSNEIQPFPVEPGDRRMLVVWPTAAMPIELQNRTVAELENGGATAFYNWLLAQDLSDFDPHTKPPMTEAKERLIDFGRAGWDTFYREWERGALKAPYQTCLVTDLYRQYKFWCERAGENVLSQSKFSGFIASRLRRWRDAHYKLGDQKGKGTFFVVGKQPDNVDKQVWLGQMVGTFKAEVTKKDQSAA